MSRTKKILILVGFLITIMLLGYFTFFNQMKINCFSGRSITTWNTGAESVPEYLKFKEDLNKLTKYLGCECADDPFCYSCRYTSVKSTYIYYYDNKFIVPPYEYIITDKGVEKKDLSVSEDGFKFLFNSGTVDLNLVKNGTIKEIVSSDEKIKLKIDKISTTITTNKSITGLVFSVIDDKNEYKIIQENELYKVFVHKKGIKFDDYRVDGILNKIYFTGRKKVLEDLNTLAKFENQLFDIYLKTNRVVSDENSPAGGTILKKENSIKDIYKIKDGVFIYKNNFLVEQFGGEYYGIAKYSFDGDYKGHYCENSWAVGGGGDSNPKCKIPTSAIRVDKYINLIKNKCNQ